MTQTIALLLIKATCLLLVSLAAAAVLQRSSAGSRHLVWLVALGSLLMLPVVATWAPVPLHVLPAEGAHVVAAQPDRFDRTTGDATTSIGLASASGASSASGDPVHETGPSLPAWWPQTTSGILLVAWGAVVAALLGRLAFGAWAVRRIVRRARPLEHPDWQTPLYEIADRMELQRAPRLLRSEDVKMPFAAGLLTPTIVLPAESDDWTADRRSAVLIHELGHVRRRDLIGHTLGRITCAVYWFHPLVWSAARHLRAESERACDDLALVFGARPSEYAEHLLEIVTSVRDHRTPSIALAMAHRKEFEGRMLAILNPDLRRKGPGRLQSMSLVGSLALMAVMVSAAAPVARIAPRTDAVAATRDVTTPSSADIAADVARAPTFADTTPMVRATPRPLPMATPTPHPTPTPAPSTQPTVAASIRGKASSGTRTSLARDSASDDRATALAGALRSDSSASVRRIAAWGLQQHADNVVAVQALTAAVTGDADAGVREMAAWSLAAAPASAPVTTALGKATKDRDPKVRSTAIWSLGSLEDGSAVPLLVAALADADEKVREIAAWGIGTAGPDRAPAALVNALGDPSRDVRRSVAWALFTIGDPTSLMALQAAFKKENDPEVQHSLIRAMGAMGDASVDVLEGLVSSPNPELRELAVKALAGGRVSGPWPWPRPRPRPFP